MRKHSGKAEFARTVCDSVVDGRPDFYNAPAKRPVSKEEAQKHGWSHYFDGVSQCPQGHIAARYCSNPGICVDCKRIGEGKPPIYSVTMLASDLTGAKPFVNPLADARFVWTDEKKSQLLSAWINTGGDMLAAVKIVGCQPEHVIDLKASDPDFQARYEAARLKVDIVQLWSMEKRAADNDRVGLAMSQSKFSEFGAKTGLADRPAINPEQMRAGLAQLLSSLRRSISQQDRLESAARAARTVGSHDTPATAASGEGVAEQGVLAHPHDNSDLV